MSDETLEPDNIEGGSLDVIQSQEVETAVDIAKRHPRDLKQSKEDLMQLATVDQETAESCIYSKPVDNKGTLAEGPSIRWAEMVAQSYGNIKYGSRVTNIGQKFVTVQGVAMDTQKNIFYTAEMTRSIYSEKKGRYGQNLIETTIKAAEAIAVRDAILKVVPTGFFKNEWNQVKAVAAGTVTPEGSEPEGDPKERFTKAVEYFSKQGIPEKRIYNTIGVSSLDEVTEQHIVHITGIYNTFKDGNLTLEQAFPPTDKEEKKGRGEAATKAAE